MSFERIRRPLKSLFGKTENETSVESSKDHSIVTNKKITNEDATVSGNLQYPKMVPKIYSYYADFQENNYYKNFAMALIERCQTFGVNYSIEERKSRGSYGANCLMKPEFILEKLLGDKLPMIWMDCDTDFRLPFEDFNDVTEDIGMATHSGDITGIKASPLFFNYSPGAFRIIREWVVHSRAAFVKNIPELDHDALKHYVLPTLSGQYTIHLLSHDWQEFVYGKYINNGNSKVDGKMEIHRKVGVEDHVRASYSQGVKTMFLYFSENNEEVFGCALSFLEKFSNYTRIIFHFKDTLEEKASHSFYFKKLYIESGGNVIFGPETFDNHLYLRDQIVLDIKNVFDIQKNWDIKIIDEIMMSRNPLYSLNFEDDGIGYIKIKNQANLWS